MTIRFPGVPGFDEARIDDVLRDFYGLSGGLTRLDSERDQNVLVTSERGRFVMKISNAAETAEALDFQAAMLDHMMRADPTLPLPALVRTLTGHLSVTMNGPGGSVHHVRLLSFLDGGPLAKAVKTAALLEELGETLGRMSVALSGFIHRGAVRAYEWDLKRAGDSRGRLAAIASEADRAMLARFIDRFEADVLSRLARLRSGVIHNDGNDWNVLVGSDGHISGIIDFGDALHSALICEVAIAAAYAALGSADPLAGIGAVAAGFHRAMPLDGDELDILFDLVAMRLVASVTLSASRRDAVAGNAYLAISEEPAFALLRRLDGIDPRIATAILRKACGLEAAPGATRLRDWIAANRRSFAPVLDRPAASYPAAFVPYDDPAHPMSVASAQMRPDRAQAIWEKELAASGAVLGVGRWGEERSVYAGDLFRSRLIDGARRVCHLGLDLFLPACAPVYTPIDATVRSVEIEENPLGYGCLVTLAHAPEDGVAFVSLWGHLAHEAVGRLKPGDRLEAGALVGLMGPPEENGGWAPHLHLQISADPRLDATDILGVGEKAYLDVWAELFPDASLFAGLAPELYASAGLPPREIVQRRGRLLLPNLSITYDKPIKFVRGEGVWLIDDRGRAYLDCFNNVSHVGHSHPAVVEALSRQAGILNTNTRYLHDNIVAYAERLTGLMPKELCVAAFVNSGSEANSLALRMMRAVTGRENVVALDWAYHGTTQELIDISPYKFRQKGGVGQKPHVHVAEIADPYRAPADWDPKDHGRRYAESVTALIEAMRAKGEGPGAFIAESMPSVAGQIVLPDGYLEAVYREIRAAGGLCIADEVQVGFGRVGSHWWAFETQGVVPDIVTLGKPIGDGHPMAALVTTRDVADAFNTGMEYFNTFGGNPVSCAVGLAVIDVIEEGNLVENARVTGDYIIARLKALATRYEAIGDVRGAGLFLGIELVADRTTKAPDTAMAKRVVNRARDLGVLMGTEGPQSSILKLRPPMIFSRRDADHLVAVLEESFAFAAA